MRRCPAQTNAPRLPLGFARAHLLGAAAEVGIAPRHRLQAISDPVAMSRFNPQRYEMSDHVFKPRGVALGGMRVAG